VGIRAYLTKFAYSNASAEDFWGTMTEATKQPLDRIFSSFVLQPGVPLVTVDTTCEDGKTHVTLTQRRFAGSTQNGVWTVPIVARTLDATKTIERFLLDQPSQTFSFSGCQPHLFLNTDGRGYYRTAYAPGVLESDRRLRDALT